MDVLDIFTLVVITVLVAVAIVIVVVLGGLPGKIAGNREHPQGDAINVCGWIGILTLGILWPVALVWAFTRPSETLPNATVESAADITTAQAADLVRALERISHRIDALEVRVGGIVERDAGAKS